MGIIAASPADEPAIRQLLTACELRTADLDAGALRNFLVLREHDALAGTVGLDLAGEHALLRSLAVAPLSRGGGHGHALVKAAEQVALSCGVHKLFLLTTTAEKFFAARGYELTPREQAPAAIRAMPQFAGLCPSSSSFMSKVL